MWGQACVCSRCSTPHRAVRSKVACEFPYRWRRADDQGAAVPGHRRCGHDRFHDHRPAGGGGCGGGDRAGQSGPRPAGEPGRRAGVGEGPAGRGRHPGPRPGARAHGRDRPGLSPGSHPDHPVRHRAQARPGGPGRRHLRGRRGGGGCRCPQGGRRVVGVGLWAGGGVPHHREAPPLRQRHPLRGGQDLQRGAAAQLHRHAGPAVCGAAVLQCVRAPDGHLRPVHRGPDPVDGADRGRPAPAHPR